MNDRSGFKERQSDVVTLMQWVIRIGSTLGAFGVILGTIAWAADTTYARKTEVQQVVQQAADGLRKSGVEDKIFEIQLIQADKRSDVQRALLDRYLREHEELNRKINK